MIAHPVVRTPLRIGVVVRAVLLALLLLYTLVPVVWQGSLATQFSASL